MTEGSRYDLIFETGGTAQARAVQVGEAKRRDDQRQMPNRANTASGYVRSTYSAAEIDAIAAYCLELDECWLIPISHVAGQKVLRLRLAPAKNNQRSGVTIAETYRLGAIAQLGERVAGSHEVGGSSPPGSIARELSGRAALVVPDP